MKCILFNCHNEEMKKRKYELFLTDFDPVMFLFVAKLMAHPVDATKTTSIEKHHRSYLFLTVS